MILPLFSIRFEFKMRQSSLVIPLIAEVSTEPGHKQYIVRNFRTASSQEYTLLPELRLNKQNGVWVHAETSKETELSIAIGEAIERFENDHSSL